MITKKHSLTGIILFSYELLTNMLLTGIQKSGYLQYKSVWNIPTYCISVKYELFFNFTLYITDL